MKFLVALLAGIGGAIICGPAAAVLFELAVVPIFYATRYEADVAMAAVYVVGPAAMFVGAVVSARLALQNVTGDNQLAKQTSNERFTHE